jgi:alkylation response protein AidB-like acyl-CoA dehydrogenase
LDKVFKVHELFPQDIAPAETVDMIIGEVAKFSEKALFPIYQVGDQGCKYDGDNVTTPPGWKEAYAQYVEGGWPTLAAAPEFGGQNFPWTLDAVKTEFCATANWTWFMYPMLSHGCVECLLEFASAEMKNKFLPKLISGEWTGTMCLTEPGAGSDLSDIKTKAVPAGNDSYKISGTKIFISCGECDFSSNIIHLVLAKLPDAPAGTKGISLFLVSKYMINEDGTLDTSKKNVLCTGIEHKMGIKGSATAVLSFENSIGYLIGKPHEGMKQMFAFMNTARLAVGTEGLGHAELSYQQALAYARERCAGRAPGKPVQPEKSADPIIYHPDVSRMLFKMKAFTEGARCLVYHTSVLMDKVRYGTDAKTTKKCSEELALLTPIVKAFLTETGFEITNDGLQVYGGHGYINEWGLEQIVRDARISTLYEGTTGIQSLDLLGRKVIMNQVQTLATFCRDIRAFCDGQMGNLQMLPHTLQLMGLTTEWTGIAASLAQKAMKDPAQVESAAVDFMYYSGYVTLAYMWLRIEAESYAQLAAKAEDAAFYQSKIATAQFFYARMLPRTKSYAALLMSAAPKDVANLDKHSVAMDS